jgi:hypothetical protein
MSDKPEQKTINAVRQILMNELGFTRESVRQEMQKIVKDEVDKHIETYLNRVSAETLIVRAIENKLTSEIKGSGWAMGITSRVDKEIREQVSKAITNKIIISLKREVPDAE